MYPRLSKAPIAEALIDLRVEAAFSLDDLASFSSLIHPEFPDVHDISVSHHTVAFGAQGSVEAAPPSPPQVIGRIHWNRDRTVAVQATFRGENSGPGGFTINWTQDYTTFDDLLNLAKGLWPSFCSTLHPNRIIRCALRYINKVDIQSGLAVNRVLATAPCVGGEIPQLIDDFFLRAVVPLENSRRVVVTQSLGQAGDFPMRKLFLDIDAISEKVIDPSSIDLWNELFELRKIKNNIFFRSFTAETLEGFK